MFPSLSVSFYKLHIQFQKANCFGFAYLTFADQSHLFREPDESPISVFPIGDLCEHCETQFKTEKDELLRRNIQKYQL